MHVVGEKCKRQTLGLRRRDDTSRSGKASGLPPPVFNAKATLRLGGGTT